MPDKQRTHPTEENEKEPVAGNLAHQQVEHLIEQLRQRSAELEEANRELRRVSHYRSLFLARMSHELRTPLTSILGFSEILLDQEQLTDTQRRFCQKIQDSGVQLQASLNQLVDLSRLEAGQGELFFQEFSLRELLRDSCAAVMRAAQKRQVNVEYDLCPANATIVSDQGKLRQILYSFLAWSVGRSEPETSVRMDGDFSDDGMLRIRISDEGQPVSSLASVFDPESIGSEEPDINDLGIIIGRRLLELLNGSVKMKFLGTKGMETRIEVACRASKA
jgi:signal transduction histidine kinase